MTNLCYLEGHMKSLLPFYLFVTLALVNSGCTEPEEKEATISENVVNKAPIKNFKLTLKSSLYRLGDSIKIDIQGLKESIQPDSILVNSKVGKPRVLTKNQTIPNLTQKCGSYNLGFTLYKNGHQESHDATITVFSNVQPFQFKPKVKNTFPHDASAYTQGLEFVNNEIYETTGIGVSPSSIRKTIFQTGEVSKISHLGDVYFGEGFTYLHEKFYQLTWQKNTWFIFDKELNLLEKRPYTFETEGWGLTNNDTLLIMSNGSEVLYYLDPLALSPSKEIQVYTNEKAVLYLNELELIKGFIFANVYQTDDIVIIHPQTGAVVGILNCENILPLSERNRNTNVLNGIAYNPKDEMLIITGKNWPKSFQIELPDLTSLPLPFSSDMM